MTSEIKVNKVSDSCGSALVTKCGSTITLGASGKTVSIACGASTVGMGRTGTVDWCTTAKTSPFTAVNGKGYFVNTTGGTVTVTLPSSPTAGNIIAISDYANTFSNNKVTIGRNSSKINGGCFDSDLNTTGQSVTLVYVDATRGWKTVTDSTANVTGQPNYVTASGGTETTSGDYKIHTFTADGNFVVTAGGLPAGSDKVSYMVVAGGGGGGGDHGGGGGAGGFREGKCSSDPYTDSPLDAGVGLSVTAQTYPITVGAGGAGGEGQPSPNNPSGQGTWGTPGNNSIFSTITSTGGGGGAKEPYPYGQPTTSIDGGVGRPGGSGGGGSYTASGTPQGGTGGTGNTPPVSPPQGNNGGTSPSVGSGSPYNAGQGGGGATAAGTGVAGSAGCAGGGAGATTSITASPVAYAGGGGGARGGSGGSGGGGNGGNPGNGTSGTTNRGVGGGGGYPDPQTGGAGGSGIVVIRYKYQN